MNHGKPIPKSTPSRRAFNTPNAAGVSRDTNDGSSSDQRPTGQPASSTFQRRDANGTTACTTAARGQAASQKLDAKTKTVAAGRRNPVKFGCWTKTQHHAAIPNSRSLATKYSCGRSPLTLLQCPHSS